MRRLRTGLDHHAELQAALSQHLGAHVLEQILVLAAATPRAQVLSRAEHVLTDEMVRTAPPP